MNSSDDAVSDDEILYRSVRESDILRDENGIILRIASPAFNDRVREVSLDRAKFRTSEQSRFRASDTVVSLRAGDIRAITDIVHGGQQYQIEVRPDPILNHPEFPDNPAHSVVVGNPHLTKQAFEKLKPILALLCWVVLEGADDNNDVA